MKPDYLTTTAAARKWGLSTTTVGVYCREGRIPNLKTAQADRSIIWLIPADAEKPTKKKMGRPKIKD